MYRFFADALVIVHALYVGFVVVGLFAILLGAALKWKWVRNIWFRSIHLVAIGIVVFEAAFGLTCPLTTWERNLRQLAGEQPQDGSFMGRIAHNILFYDAPQWCFSVGHCVFGALVLLTFLLVPPYIKKFHSEDSKLAA